MFEWLHGSLSEGLDVSAQQIVVRLGLAGIAGLLVAAIGHVAHGHRKSDGQALMSTLVLLTVLLAMVTLVIGNSVARAFGLVGALSIVRFRTVVDDTRDTAFVIFSVVVGMAIGAGTFLVPAIGIPLVALLAIGFDRFRLVAAAPGFTHKLTVRLGLGREPAQVFGPVFSRYLRGRSILSASTVKQGSALEVCYQVTFVDLIDETMPTQLVAELNQIEGVQSIELNRL